MPDISNPFEQFSDRLSLQGFIWSIVFIVLGIAAWLFIRRIRDGLSTKITGNSPADIQKRSAVLNVSRVIKVVLIAVTALVVLQINGVNVSSLIASFGIAGAVAGLAWQDVIKDIIQGVRLTTDGFFSVGDCIRYNGEDYQVTDFTIRTTHLKKIYNGDITIVCNRNLAEITKLSGREYINIGFAYEDDSEKIDALLQKCVKSMSELPGVSNAEYLGLQCFNSSSIGYMIAFTGNPTERGKNVRAALRIIRDEMKHEGIELPFDQIVLHNSSE